MTFRGFRIRWVNFCVNRLYAGTKTKNLEKKRKLLNSVGHSIGEGTKVVGPIYCGGKMIVGKNCWIGRNLEINGNGTVTIGDQCDIAPDVIFQTGSHEIGGPERRAGEGITEDITVGNGCWIGVRSTILGGVSISDGAVIAACALVNKKCRRILWLAGFPHVK